MTVRTTIACPICNCENNGLRTTCEKCGAFIQDRLPKLDLFATIYHLLDEPSAAFHRIARSEQKNYTYTLFACAGIAFTAVLFTLAKAGNVQTNFIFTFAKLVLLSPVVGLAVCSLISLFVWQMNTRVWKVAISFRVCAAIFAFTLIPIIASALLVLPIELGLFGEILFSDNPPPWIVKPGAFYLLSGLDAAAFLWTVILFFRGYRAVYSIASWKHAITALSSLLIAVAILVACSRMLIFIL